VVTRIESALQLLQGDDIGLIICAVYLENGDVYQFLAEVKSNLKLQHIPFVFYCYKTSKFAQSIRTGLQVAAEYLGADLYITMERFDGELLAAQIERCLKGDGSAGIACRTSEADSIDLINS
jgi:CheY-like chemotaxis protein